MSNIGRKLPGGTFKVPGARRLGNKNALQFFQYWRRMTDEEAERCSVRMYRTWPLVNLKLTDPNRKTIEWHVFEGKLPFEDPEEFEDYFLKKFGSGGWKLIMAENGVDGEVMTVNFEALDYDNHPPLVELKTVLWDHEGNKGYKRWLRTRNIPIPGDDGLEDPNEGEEMKLAGEAFAAVTEQNSQLHETLLETVKESAEARVAAAKAETKQPSLESKTIDSAFSAASKVVEMVTKNAGQQYDPFAGIEKVVSLIEARGNGGKENLEFMKILMETTNSGHQRERENQREQLEFMKTILMDKAKSESAVVAPPPPQRDLIDDMERIGKFKAGFAELFGKPARASNDGGENWAQTIMKAAAENPEVLKAASAPITALITGVFHWLKPTPAAGKSPEELAAKSGGNGAVPPNPPRVAAGPSPEEQERMAREMFCRRIARGLVTHLADANRLKLNGYTWAEFILNEGLPEAGPSPDGRAFYEQLKAMKYQGVTGLIHSYQPLVEAVNPHGARFPEFWVQFENYDAWAEKQQKEKEEE